MLQSADIGRPHKPALQACTRGAAACPPEPRSQGLPSTWRQISRSSTATVDPCTRCSVASESDTLLPVLPACSRVPLLAPLLLLLLRLSVRRCDATLPRRRGRQKAAEKRMPPAQSRVCKLLEKDARLE